MDKQQNLCKKCAAPLPAEAGAVCAACGTNNSLPTGAIPAPREAAPTTTSRENATSAFSYPTNAAAASRRLYENIGKGPSPSGGSGQPPRLSDSHAFSAMPARLTAEAFSAAPTGNPAPAKTTYTAQGGTSPATAGVHRRTPPEQVLAPRRRWPVLLLSIVAVVVALLTLFYFFFSTQLAAEQQESYAQLVQSICASKTPTQAAEFRAELDTFAATNPGMVERDLETLVATCENYIAAPAGADKFTRTISQLEALTKSSIERIATCANNLLSPVYVDYNAFLETALAATSSSSQTILAGVSTETPLLVEGAATLGTADGETGFSITALNTSGKTINYIEVVLFCYDASGNEIIGSNGYSWEWVYDYVTLPAGHRHTPEEHSYWHFTNCSNVAIGIPYINYVRFADGTEWGFSTSSMAITDDFVERLSVFKQSCDTQAKNYASDAATTDANPLEAVTPPQARRDTFPAFSDRSLFPT